MALNQLLDRGVRLEAHEAVALARELMAYPGGMPTRENIQLGSDGSAACISPDGVPTVASVAGLLLTLLPPGTPNVRGPLRYAIARGLEAVDAPPFASLAEFSSALERFEKGERRDVLKGVLQRGAVAVATPVAATPAAVAPASIGRPPSSRRWVLPAAAALLASFVLGFAIAKGITSRRAATQQSTAAPVPPAVSPVPPMARPAAPAAVKVAPQVGAIQAVRAISANAYSPAFAADGTAIFFHTGRERDARSAIEVAIAGNQTGREPGSTTIVDDGSRNYHAQPSPDGRLVAFDSDRDGVRGVYVANRDGSQIRRVSGAGFASLPTWSRNGEWLAYVRTEPGRPSVRNLWVQRAAGGTARRLTNHRFGQTWAASWFPDDRRIAYSHEDTLIVMDVQTGQARRYRTPVKGRLVRTPAVSPDGTKVIFQVFRHGAWLLDLADGSMQRVLTDATAEEFAWSPDGRQIAFHSRRGGQWGIYVLSRS